MSYDISRITDFLYISAWPEGQRVDEILGLNIRLILSMHWLPANRALGKAPLHLLWLPSVDTPPTPIRMSYLIKGVETALPVIAGGNAVLAHCKKGVHRSVIMACSVLIGTGMEAEAAMREVKARRSIADPDAPYVRKQILAFEQAWSQRQTVPIMPG